MVVIIPIPVAPESSGSVGFVGASPPPPPPPLDAVDDWRDCSGGDLLRRVACCCGIVWSGGVSFGVASSCSRVDNNRAVSQNSRHFQGIFVNTQFLLAAFSSCGILSTLVPLVERLTAAAVWRAVLVTNHRTHDSSRIPEAGSVSPWKTLPPEGAAEAE